MMDLLTQERAIKVRVPDHALIYCAALGMEVNCSPSTRPLG